MPSLASTLVIVLVLAAVAVPARADVYTYPVKSINLDAASSVSFYVAYGSTEQMGTVDDLHPVHGVQTTDGSYVIVGKALESEFAENTEAFAMCLDAQGALKWGWRSGLAGSDAANAVAQVSSTEVVVVGWRTAQGSTTYGQRTMWKLRISDGTQVWSASSLGDTSTTGAYEMIDVTGDAAYVAGFYGKNDLTEMSFKSYGNVADGIAIVQRFPLSALVSATAPSATDATWSQSWSGTGFVTAKAARPIGDAAGRLAVLLYGEATDAKSASVAVLSAATGAAFSSVWAQPKEYGGGHGEATDMQVCVSQTAVILSGHRGYEGTLNGTLSRISLSDGSRTWTQQYSVGGNPNLISNECWGLARVGTTGCAMSCGAGIEHCNAGLSTSDLADCQAGIGDKRPGALPRPVANWQSYVPRVDRSGVLQWQRVDSHKHAGDPDLGANGFDPGSSAAEWIIETMDGGLAIIQDEAMGVGLMKLAPEGTATPTTPTEPATSTEPTTPVPTMPAEPTTPSAEPTQPENPPAMPALPVSPPTTPTPAPTPTPEMAPPPPVEQSVTVSGRLTYAGPLADCKTQLKVQRYKDENYGETTHDLVTNSDGTFTYSYNMSEFYISDYLVNNHTYDMSMFSGTENGLQSAQCTDAFTGKTVGVFLAGYAENGHVDVMGNPGATMLKATYLSGIIEDQATAELYVKKFLGIDDSILHFGGFDYLAKAQAGMSEALGVMTSIQKMTTVLSLGTEYFANALTLDTDTASLMMYGALAAACAARYQGLTAPSAMTPFNFESANDVLAVLEAAYTFDPTAESRRLQQLPAGMLDALTAISTVSTHVNTQIQQKRNEASAKVQSGEATLDAALTTLFTETTKLAMTVEEGVKGSVVGLATGVATATQLTSSYTPEAIATAASAQTVPATFTAASATLKEQGTLGGVVPPATTLPPAPSSESNDDETTLMIIIISVVVPVVVCAIAGAVFFKRKNKECGGKACICVNAAGFA